MKPLLVFRSYPIYETNPSRVVNHHKNEDLAKSDYINGQNTVRLFGIAMCVALVRLLYHNNLSVRFLIKCYQYSNNQQTYNRTPYTYRFNFVVVIQDAVHINTILHVFTSFLAFILCYIINHFVWVVISRFISYKYIIF